MDALRVLKIIESDESKRKATPEEQAIIARYSGFGDSAFGQAFDPKYRSSSDKSPLDPFEKRGAELKELVTPEEFNSIKASRTTAFYTTPEVVKSMWDALVQMGATKLEHPRILEPSAGSGRFLGYEPTELAARSIRTAVEKDSLTGRLLRQAYPDTQVHITGFEDAPIPDNSMDIAISNVPFGNVAIHDNSPEYNKKSGRSILKRSIHNYFFAKSLDKLRPGGILAFVTSHNTLDAPTAKPIRELLADQADFVSATRLPNTAFGDTKVVTDIIFMRKRTPGDAPSDRSWIETTKVNLPYKIHSDYSYRPDETYQKEVDINSYFINHPENVLGKNTIGAGGGMYGQYEYTVEPLTKGEPPTPETISNAVTRVPRNILKEDVNRNEVRRAVSIQGAHGYEGTRHIADDDTIFITRNNGLVPSGYSAGDTERVKAMLAIRDAGRNVLQIQLRDGTDVEVIEAQKSLNTIYEKFATENGALNNTRNAELMKDDPDGPFLRALEIWDKKKTPQDTQRATTLSSETAKDLRMPLFTKRVVKGLKESKAATESDASAISLNETGRLDLNRMGELLGKSNNEVSAGLVKQGLIFKNPVGDWEPRDKYLSGDVREKLKTAILAAKANPAYQGNADALRAVQPTDVPPSQIALRLGTPWVPETDVDAFVHELLGVPREQTQASRRDWQNRDNPIYKPLFHYRPDNGEWMVDGSPTELMRSGNEALMKNEYGTERMPASYLITNMLNGKLVEIRDETGELSEKGNPITERNIPETVAAQAKADIIQAKFREWIWSDPDRAKRLSTYYNETFNSMKPRAFDGAHQTLPGMTTKWAKQIHAHQKDAIWRVVQDRTALLAHEVGFGKTAVMVGAGMELRRLGLSRKNLFVVPKATHEQFKNQFKDIYPYANVLFPNDDDFTEGKRGEFIARAATGDWDAIILADSQFRTIEVKPETQAKFLREELNALRSALEDESGRGGSSSKKSGTSKDIEKAIERVSVRLKDATDKIAEKHEHTMYFEDLGVDQLFVDEADAYKNLHFATRMGRLKGLPNSDSERAWDMYMKTRNLQQGKGQGVVFATGTPIANTVAEMFTMMRYLQEPMLEAKGLQHFDTWAKTFGDTTEGLEQNAAGNYVTTQRFSKFVNIPELSNIWQQTADIRVADEVPSMRAQQPRLVNDKGEKAGRAVIAAPPDEALRDYMVELAVRADEMKGKDPREDNMLKLASDARKASLDMRMVKPYAPANPEGKVALAARNIARIYEETTPDKGTQLVFLDLGTPKASDGKDKPVGAEGDVDEDEGEDEPSEEVLRDVYGRIRKLLVAQDVPNDKIAYIHDAKTNTQKKTLYDKVNDGDIRVIIGSTGKLGTGVNIQKRAAAVHHLDAPWRPRDIEQREGRIIRQGNEVYGPQKDDDGNITSPGKGVRIYTYVTEHSFDAFMWQAIEAKAKAIKSIMRRDTSGVRQVDDADSLTMSAGQAKAVATGNPDVMKAVQLQNDIYKLGMLRGSHLDAKVRAQSKLKELPEQIKWQTSRIAKMEKDSTLVNVGDKFSFTVRGKSFGEKERAAAGDALQAAIIKAPVTEDTKFAPVLGNYKGFDVRALTATHIGIPYTRLLLTNPGTGGEYATTEMEARELTGGGAVTRVTNRVADIAKEMERVKLDVAKDETNLRTYQKQYEVPFAQEGRLSAMIAELNRLNERLAGKKDALNEEAIAIPAEDLLTEQPTEAAPEYHFAAKDMPEFKPVEIIEKPIEAARQPEPIPEVRPIVAPMPVVAKHVETDEEMKARILKEQFPNGVPTMKPTIEKPTETPVKQTETRYVGFYNGQTYHITGIDAEDAQKKLAAQLGIKPVRITMDYEGATHPIVMATRPIPAPITEVVKPIETMKPEPVIAPLTDKERETITKKTTPVMGGILNVKLPEKPVNERLKRIAEASRRPMPGIREVIFLKGTDRLWHNPGGFPSGVDMTGEKRVEGYAFEKDGVTYGTREKTKENLIKRFNEHQDSNVNDLYTELGKMPPERVNSQEEYWLKTAPAPAPPQELKHNEQRRAPVQVATVEHFNVGTPEPKPAKAPYEYGKEAYANGKKAPAQDKAFLDAYSVPGAKVGEGRLNQDMGEWNRGFLDAHAAAVGLEPKTVIKSDKISVQGRNLLNKPERKLRKLLTADQISDFEPNRDKVIREGDKTFVVDTKGEHARIEVQPDVITPVFKENIGKLDSKKQHMFIQFIKTTPYLSDEGRTERLNTLKEMGIEVTPTVTPESYMANLKDKRQALITELRKRADVVEAKANTLTPGKAKTVKRVIKAARLEAAKLEKTIPAAERSPAKRTKREPLYTIGELREIQAARSPRAKAADNARLNARVISPSDANATTAWIARPGSSDISGIDTPNGKSAQITVRPKPPRATKLGKTNPKVETQQSKPKTIKPVERKAVQPKAEKLGKLIPRMVVIRQNKRSDLAKAIDNAQKAPTVPPARYNKWMKHPNRFDIKGVDTPSSTRSAHAPAPTSKASNALHSQKKGRVFHTKVGGQTLLSRKPLGRRR